MRLSMHVKSSGDRRQLSNEGPASLDSHDAEIPGGISQRDAMTTTVANQNWKEFNLRYVTDYRLRRSTKGKLLSRILDGIDRHSDRLALDPR